MMRQDTSLNCRLVAQCWLCRDACRAIFNSIIGLAIQCTEVQWFFLQVQYPEKVLKKSCSYGYNSRDPALYRLLDKRWPFCLFIFFGSSDHLFVVQQTRMILFWVMHNSKAFLKLCSMPVANLRFKNYVAVHLYGIDGTGWQRDLRSESFQTHIAGPENSKLLSWARRGDHVTHDR